MLNKIVCDKDLNVELVINIQEPRTFDDTWANSIIIEIDADDTASQSLIVDAGEATGSYPVTPSQINEIEIETEYWNMGGATTITLVKGSTDYGTIIINFPDEIDSLGMLNRDENIETTFTMTGSYNDPSDLSKEVKDVSDKVDDLQNNKQNFIEQDLLPPSQGVGVDGDLKFKGVNGNGDKELWRNDSGTWVKINLGGGGFVGDAGACRTLLYSTSSATFVSDIQLSDDMRNYQYLEIYTRQNNNMYDAFMSYIIDVDYFISNFPYSNSPSPFNPHFLLSMYQGLYTRIICGSDYTKILAFDGTAETVVAVYGVSFGHVYNSHEAIYGSFFGRTIYERTLLFFDQGQPASGWTNVSGQEWKYSDITSADIETLWSADVINCDQNGNYSYNPSPYVAWNEANGDFNLNFGTSYYTWLHIVYMR